MNWRERIQQITLTPEMTQGEYICRCADKLGIEPRYIVEIGSYRGATAMVFRSWFPSAKLIMVDPWTHKIGDSRDSIAEWENIYSRVCDEFAGDIGTFPLRCHSALASCYCPDGIDILYVNGVHTYEGVMSDLTHWLPKMRKPSIVAGYDDRYSEAFEPIWEAVDETLGATNVWLGPTQTWIHYHDL